MTTKRFSTFEEIDQQLRILRLQRDISSERIKLQFNELISNFRLYPLQVIENIGNTIQKLLLVFAIKKLRGIFGK